MYRNINGKDARMKVVLTGALGRVGSLLAPALSDRYDTVLIDRTAIDAEGGSCTPVHAADLSGDRGAFRHHFEGADAVVHCAFRFTPETESPDARFQMQLSNLTIAHNIYRVALECGVGRVVMCSTNHVADYYEPLLLDGAMDQLSTRDRPLAKDLYGWAQESSEHLGFLYALGHMSDGKRLSNIQIRIGCPCDIWPAPQPGSDGYERRRRRWVAACISTRDMIQLFVRSLETEDIRNEHGLPYQVFYGISRNAGAMWSLQNAVDILGYQPQDNGEKLIEYR